MIVLIDHYDSFTDMLADYCRRCAQQVRIVRSDQLDCDEVAAWQPSHLILSPGPGHPSEAGGFHVALRRFHRQLPILGVCLGHQAIWQYFGGHVQEAKSIMHGRLSRIEHDGSSLFAGIPVQFQVTRYHSLLVDEHGGVPAALRVSARSEAGEVMALSHIDLPIFAVQYHPEAALTEYGLRILQNFFSMRPAGQERV